MKFSIRRPYLLPNVEHAGTLCHPLWRLVAINCLMFHAPMSTYISPMRSDGGCFRKLFFQKRIQIYVGRNSLLRGSVLHRTRMNALVTFFPFFPSLPPTRTASAPPTFPRLRSSYAQLRMSFAAKYLRSEVRFVSASSENERIKMDWKCYRHVDRIFIAWVACFKYEVITKNFSLLTFLYNQRSIKKKSRSMLRAKEEAICFW